MNTRAILCFVIAGVLGVSACDLSIPSQVHTGHIRLVDKTQTAELSPRSVDAAAVARLVEEYNDAGSDSGMDVTIGYMQESAADESAARKVGDKYLYAFRGAGMTDPVRLSIVPVTQKEMTRSAVASYRRLTAEQPEGCPDILGTRGAEKLQVGEKYPMGCGHKTMLSKMVSRPADLKGVAGTGDSDSRRQGAVVEKHKAGEQNEKLQGINASTVGSGG
jgi:type IV pilus biogenesis protein CpaD/CtpE